MRMLTLIFSAAFLLSSCDEVTVVAVEKVTVFDNHILVYTGQMCTIDNFDSSQVSLRKECFSCEEKYFDVIGCTQEKASYDTATELCTETLSDGSTATLSRGEIIFDTGNLASGTYYLTFSPAAFYGTSLNGVGESLGQLKGDDTGEEIQDANADAESEAYFYRFSR